MSSCFFFPVGLRDEPRVPSKPSKSLRISRWRPPMCELTPSWTRLCGQEESGRVLLASVGCYQVGAILVLWPSILLWLSILCPHYDYHSLAIETCWRVDLDTIMSVSNVSASFCCSFFIAGASVGEHQTLCRAWKIWSFWLCSAWFKRSEV